MLTKKKSILDVTMNPSHIEMSQCNELSGKSLDLIGKSDNGKIKIIKENYLVIFFCNLQLLGFATAQDSRERRISSPPIF